jgi:predicted trehalose synthase
MGEHTDWSMAELKAMDEGEFRVWLAMTLDGLVLSTTNQTQAAREAADAAKDVAATAAALLDKRLNSSDGEIKKLGDRMGNIETRLAVVRWQGRIVWAALAAAVAAWVEKLWR